MHEPIISEELFNEVQYVLDGNRRNSRPNARIMSHEKLPLRGYLLCPKCGKNLTGSGSKGNGGCYFYYHCQPSCGFRYNAEDANDMFVEELEQYEFGPSTQQILQQILLNCYKQIAGKGNDRQKQISDEPNLLNNKLSVARNKLLMDKIDDDDYYTIKSELKPKIEKLEQQLEQSKSPKSQTDIEGRLNKALSAVCNVSKFYQESGVETKRSIIGSIYPEKLEFSENAY